MAADTPRSLRAARLGAGNSKTQYFQGFCHFDGCDHSARSSPDRGLGTRSSGGGCGGKSKGADGAGVSRVSAMGEPEHENHVNYGVLPICLTLLAAGWISQLWKGLALSCVDLRKPW